MALDLGDTFSVVQDPTIHTPNITGIPITEILLHPGRLKRHFSYPTGNNLNSRDNMFFTKLVIKGLSNFLLFNVRPEIPKVKQNRSGAHNKYKKKGIKKKGTCGTELAGEEKT